MFQPVPPRPNFLEMEQRILDFWRERNIFHKSLEQRRGGPLFMLYEGPPTANASPGVHHVLSRVFKDIFPRYKTMKGYYAPRKAGWDTHGLPVELEVEQRLGFSSKTDIESYGVSQFNEKCRRSVLSHIEEWERLTERIGFWLDMEHPYITLDNDYIETCWWIVKQLWDKGLIYQGYKVTPHCPRCGTSLSSHEVALGYKDDTPDPSVYIKFRLTAASQETLSGKLGLGDGNVDTFFLAWTTTPWTLLGNTALAVAKDAEYALVELRGSTDDERLILAMALLESALKDEYQIVATLRGEDLLCLKYEALYDLQDFEKYPEFAYVFKLVEGMTRPTWDLTGPVEAYYVAAGDFVSMEDGTGIVHIAPAYGEVDMEFARKEGIELFLHPVRLNGRIDDALKPFNGLPAKEADPLILDDLKSRGLLYRSETIRHTYPFCWRCDTPLLYYAKRSWYIKTTAMKDRLISNNAEINWYPDYIKYGRFGDWLENNVDWAFSRERYWGTPLPIWCCESKGCGHEECIGSLDELKAKQDVAGAEGLSDLHRPYVDRVTYSCPECGGRMCRVPEVLDCWFDSGAMPLAQWHYPFENESLLQDGRFPADFISEAVDQTRGWFYSLHALSTLLFDRPSFRNVICLGHILDSKGEKMSKSKGNIIDPWEVLSRFSADTLRWHLIVSSPPGNSRRLSMELLSEPLRKFLLTLWNTHSFFVTYANIDEFDPRTASPDYRSDLDRWILSELNQLIAEVTAALEHYDPTGAGRKIEEFLDQISNWYVRRSRRRFWKSENDADKRAAHATLYQCLVTLAQLLAPFTPFIAEELYQNLVRSCYPESPESIHLADFPSADEALIDEELSADMKLAMKVASLGRAARSKAGLKVRQPLSRVMVRVRGKQEEDGLRRLESQVLDELNVKEMTFIDVDEFAEPGYTVAAEGGYIAAIATELTPELAEEGLARELVHRLQTMRKQADFEIADYIQTYYQGGPIVQGVIERFGTYIKQETLSTALLPESPPQGAYVESHKLSTEEIVLGVKR